MKELIKQDFLDWLSEESPELTESLYNAIYEYGLIDSASNESLNVSDNESKKKVCSCYYKENIYGSFASTCDYCGRVYFH